MLYSCQILIYKCTHKNAHVHVLSSCNACQPERADFINCHHYNMHLYFISIITISISNTAVAAVVAVPLMVLLMLRIIIIFQQKYTLQQRSWLLLRRRLRQQQQEKQQKQRQQQENGGFDHDGIMKRSLSQTEDVILFALIFFFFVESNTLSIIQHKISSRTLCKTQSMCVKCMCACVPNPPLYIKPGIGV